MKKIISLILIACAFLKSYSQSVEFEKANFPGRKDELKDAIRKLDIGTEFYVQGRKEFDEKRKSFCWKTGIFQWVTTTIVKLVSSFSEAPSRP